MGCHTLATLLGIDASSASLQAAFAAWERVGKEVAAQGATVLVFEDLLWADDGPPRGPTGLMGHLVKVPLHMLTTARTELLDRAAPSQRRPSHPKGMRRAAGPAG